MIETNTETAEFSLVAKGRKFLEQGDVSSAVECYGKVFDPEALDETEARNMLIEARSHLSRKHLSEALDCFEEALVMGTDVQRRQALDGISTIGKIRSQLGSLTLDIKKSLKDILGKRPPAESSLALVSDDENVVLISNEAFERLPIHLAKSTKISRLPPHLIDYPLPFKTDKCICYTDKEDVRYIIEVAAAAASLPEPEQNS